MVFSRVLEEAAAKRLGGINDIVQDQQGFIWFAGEAGLGRFDGHQLRLFPADTDSPYTLNSNYIRSLVVDHYGVLWVATEAGLCRYRVAGEDFDCRLLGTGAPEPLLRESVNSLALAPDNTLYAGGVAGLFEIAPNRQKVQAIAPPEGLEPATGRLSIISLALDEQNVLWVATTHSGLVAYELQSGTNGIKRMVTSPLWGTTGNKIKTLHVDQQNHLWVGTYGAGAFVLDPTRSGFSAYRAGASSGLSSNVIWDITQDSRGNVWLAVDQGGLVRFNQKEQRFEAQRANLADPSSLQSDQVRSIYEDRNGDLWLGLFPLGINFFNRTTSEIYNFRHDPANPRSLSHSSVLSLHQCEQGRVWVGTEDGLNLFDPAKGEFERVSAGAPGLPARAVLSIEQFDADTLWLGTWSGGVASFAIDTGTFTPIDTTPAETPHASNSLFIWDILRDDEGDMWLATEFNGANHFDVDSGQFTYHRATSNDPHTLADNFVWSVLQTHSGDYLFATQGGLSRYGREGIGFTQFLIQSPVARDQRSRRILSIYQDSRGLLWVGTQDRGIFVYSETGEFQRHLGLLEGMPSLQVSGFIEDDAGDVWAGTINGLARINPEQWHLSVVSSDNGLVGNNFNRNAFLKDASGRLYFGGADGMSIFHPAKLEQDRLDFDVLVTGVRIHNEPVSVGSSGAPIDRAPTLGPVVMLDHRDSMVSFEFSALNFRKASVMAYAYRLEGFDQQWHYIGENYSATYTNLPPGDYQFKVKATAGNGVWQESAPLKVTMRAAPWLSVWALLVYGLTLVALGALIASYFNLRVKSNLYQTLSIRDPLTGLHNRMGVMQHVESLFKGAVGKPLCVVFIDVDHFKRINDEYGHDAGDKILAEVAALLSDSVRQADVVGRWGGEEFILLCPGVQKEAVAGIAEKVRTAVAAHAFNTNHRPLRDTISLGIAFVQQGEQFDQAYKRADLALYQAKAQGRDRTVIADDP